MSSARSELRQELILTSDEPRYSAFLALGETLRHFRPIGDIQRQAGMLRRGTSKETFATDVVGGDVALFAQVPAADIGEPLLTEVATNA